MQIPDGSSVASWSYRVKKEGNKAGVDSGAQVDLLFDRPDGMINVCEIKYTNAPFKLEKDYALALDKRIDIFKQVTKTLKQVKLSMVTSFGVKPSLYSEDLVWSEVTAKDLFK